MAALWHDISPTTLKDMYMQEGVTYKSLAAQLNVHPITLTKYISPLLTDKEKAIKRRAPKHFSGTQQEPVIEPQEPEHVPTMRERMIERDKQLGIKREPDFGGMKLESESHVYNLRGAIGVYRADVGRKTLVIEQGDAPNSIIEGELRADDIAILIRELQTIQGLMG